MDKCKCGKEFEFVYSEDDYYFCCKIEYYTCYNCGENYVTRKGDG